MMISYLIQHNILDETGFGIYAISNDTWNLGEQTVVIDFTDNTVYEVGSDISVKWDLFVAAYRPVVMSNNISA